MKSKLLSAIAVPAMLAVGAASAMAQDANPPAATPSPAPVERAPETVTPAPSPSAMPDKTATNVDTKQSASEWRSSKVVGMAVYNRANERIGDINDLILGPDGKVMSAVIGVGGFLGIGEKLVAIDFSELQLNRDADGTMRATVNSTKESLESAPEFKYAQ